MTRASRILIAVVVTGLAAAGFRGHTDDFPKDYFRSPLAIPLMMAGNFAEMRSDHFHSGLDLKTENREGLPVYAAADGWVSRIKVSPYGYGNVVYLAHPNGYTTVYAHLSQFSDTLADYVRSLQYASSSFEVDKYLPEGRFRVKSGEVIARSGNTGSSGGPHLHFEIRNSGSQMPINPLLFGLEVHDTLPPKIFRIKVYPQEATDFVEIQRTGTKSPIIATRETPIVLDAVSVDESGRSYRLVDVDRITASGRLGFGIQVHDYHDGSTNRLGAYVIKLMEGSSLLFESELTKFTFGQTRYINAHIDYAEHRRNRRWIQRSHKLPGNALSVYSGMNDGFLTVSPDSSYQLNYVVSDAAGNTTSLKYNITGTNGQIPSAASARKDSYHISREKPRTIEGEGMRVFFPANTFYSDLDFEYSVAPGLDDSYSPVYTIHDDTVPLHRSMTLSVDASALPEALRPQALLARVNDDERLSSAGGSYRDGFVVAKPRTFGKYTIAVDTTAPSVEPWRFPKDGVFTGGSRIRIKIQDNLSGIRSYAGFVDDEWVLFAYDAKRSELSHTLDGTIEPGLHKMLVRVEDGKGNVTNLARSIRVSKP